jgi:hypothetical protein
MALSTHRLDDIHSYIFVDSNPYEEWGLRGKAIQAKETLINYTKDRLERELHGLVRLAYDHSPRSIV